MLVLAMAVSSAWGAAPAMASGCHVPDRPVLGERLTWDSVDRPIEPGSSERLAPPVLKRVPCGGEVPPVPGAQVGLTGPADRPGCRLVLPQSSESSTTDDEPARALALSSRLDRPPR